MSNVKHANGTYNGTEFTVGYTSAANAWEGLGCHSLAIQHLGYSGVTGVIYGKQQVGTVPPAGKWASAGSFDAGLTFPIPARVIRDAVFAHIMDGYKRSGVIIFSDRINRGTTASPGNSYPCIQSGGEKAFLTCAALAKWLSVHPELGTLIGGAVMNNPNYKSAASYGICQVWMWHPKTCHIWTDETLSVTGPDINLPKETVIKEIDKLGLPGKDYVKVTYDEVN